MVSTGNYQKLSAFSCHNIATLAKGGKCVVAKEVCEEVVRKKYASARTMWLSPAFVMLKIGKVAQQNTWLTKITEGSVFVTGVTLECIIISNILLYEYSYNRMK